jgi:succinoglycan biosynthesis transport protein ExoP
MERKTPASLGDFLAVIQRRKYWIIIPFVTVMVFGILLAPLVPRSYQSTTTIMVQPQKVPIAYVRPISTNEMVNRIHSIQLEVMSGPELVKVIQDLNLYPVLRKKAKMPQVVAAMDKAVTIAAAPDSSDGRGGVDAFTISYIGRTPQEAQRVTKEIADLFIQENLKEGHQQAAGTSAFLGTQVAQAAQQLAAEQAKIQAFKNAHLGSLPEQAEANVAMINQYQAQLQTNSAAIDQANQQRVYLQSVLNVNPDSAHGEAAPAPATPLQMELAQKQAELHADLLKYTPKHPDVIRLQNDIATLKLQVRQAPKATATTSYAPVSSTTGPSQIDLLRGQLVSLNTEIKARDARQKLIEQKLAQLQGAIATVPAVQTEYSSLDSQYQEMQKNYNALLEKQQEAGMAAALDRNDDSEQFMVIQPANLPGVPFRPNPVLLYMGAVLIGLFIGFLCAILVELRDDTMHTTEEAADYLKLPVIVALPKCPPFSNETWKVSTAKN